MAEQGTGVNRERIKEEFKTLVSIDAPSYHEKAISEYLKEKLEGLGLDVSRESHAPLFKVTVELP